MKRTGGRAHPSDLPSRPSSQQAHLESTLVRSQSGIIKKIWYTKRLAIYLYIFLVILFLLYTWGTGPRLLNTPRLRNFQFKIYERVLEKNVSTYNFMRRGRTILKHNQLNSYEERLSHSSWLLHGSNGLFTTSLFYVIMEVGVNRKPFYLDIDTGSSFTWLHCQLKPTLQSIKQGPNGFYDAVNSNRIVLCNDALCSLANDYHDQKQCNPSSNDYCEYGLIYADNLETQGVLVKDSMALTFHLQHVNVELVFGCGYEQRGCEYEFGPGKLDTLPSDGIMGLSRKEAAIPAQLHAQGYIRHVIGHCFLPFHKRVGTNVGVLHLGESPMTTKDITWARMIIRQRVNIQSPYEGEMVDVKYGNGLVSSFDKEHSERFVIFDSGTSMTWFTQALFLRLHKHIEAEANKIGHEALPNHDEGDVVEPSTHCWKFENCAIQGFQGHHGKLLFGEIEAVYQLGARFLHTFVA